MTKFADNFPRHELLFSETAKNNGISNEPDSPEIEENLILLSNGLQEIRDKLCEHFGHNCPVIVTSGYRNKEVNRIVGGVPSSTHMLGTTADIWCRYMTPYELAKFISDNFVHYDKMIQEFDRWVHIEMSKEDIGKQVQLTATKRMVDGRLKTHYQRGLFTGSYHYLGDNND